MNWRRETRGELQSLPHERKALAERYTIDADEADRRAQLAAEQAAARRDASAAMERDRAEQAPPSVSPEPPAPVDPEPPAEPSETVVVTASAQEELEQTADLPIYRWFGNG